VAGVAINPAVTVRIFDRFGNFATNDNTDQVTLAVASGPGGFAAGSTTTVTVSGGVATFSNLILNTSGVYTLGATATGGITGPVSASFNVIAAAATHFTVSAPASAVASAAFSFTVTALDQFNNTATGYTGTVHFTSSDGAATLPANSTLANGTGSFNATLRTAGNRTLTATDTVSSTITGTSSAIAVTPAAAATLTGTAPPSPTPGRP